MGISLLQHWLTLTLAFLGFSTLVQVPPHAIMPVQPVAVVAKATPPALKIARKTEGLKTPLNVESKAEKSKEDGRNYTYMFKGQIIGENGPSAFAHVDIRIISDMASTIQGTTAGANGEYAMVINLNGMPAQPVTWEINALSKDFEKGTLEGRQILTEKAAIQMNHALTLAKI